MIQAQLTGYFRNVKAAEGKVLQEPLPYCCFICAGQRGGSVVVVKHSGDFSIRHACPECCAVLGAAVTPAAVQEPAPKKAKERA